ncbi:MAG: NUDIX domain-containing protein [Candidatus Aenigmarchaeota archaeon]|nr:NUDIX domain-containing protein [Candidatus Aenigmarchaeota archaeon]
MQAKKIATAILMHGGKVLILKRSELVGSYRGKWAGVSGYIKPNETALQAALREVQEETGIGRKELHILASAAVSTPDRQLGIDWQVAAFLFAARRTGIKLDWEHDGLAWIRPAEIKGYQTVPRLAETLQLLLAAMEKTAGNL